MDLQGLASIVSAIAATGAVCMSWRNSRKIQSVHIDINSRMDQLLSTTGSAAHANGLAEGRAEVKK